jgi:hypothetical protein
VEWTEDTTKAFNDIRKAVMECPKLFFPSPEAPIKLFTDASEYGIGAYLCQLVETKEIPVGFMSKALNKIQLRWTTIEKECFAIVSALKKWEYLLRDSEFTLYTDHRNLVYLGDPPSPKVRRWKLAIQGFNMMTVHLKGQENLVADGFSRLLATIGKEYEAVEESLSSSSNIKVSKLVSNISHSEIVSFWNLTISGTP